MDLDVTVIASVTTGLVGAVSGLAAGLRWLLVSSQKEREKLLVAWRAELAEGRREASGALDRVTAAFSLVLASYDRSVSTIATEQRRCSDRVECMLSRCPFRPSDGDKTDGNKPMTAVT